jgi:Ca2+-binding EF-hand superfamily protein
VDIDKSGTIEFNEFVELMMASNGEITPDQEMIQAFKTFDKVRMVRSDV